MLKFTYDGPVEEFGKCVTNRWQAVTYAPTEKKARSNLAYQYKKQFNKIASTKVNLPGKLTVSQ